MSYDYSYLELNAIQRPFDYNQTNRRLSWDDFTVFYQNANDWDYPIDDTLSSSQSNKSQNPSPKNENVINIKTYPDNDKNDIDDECQVISPLSAEPTISSSEETSTSSGPIRVSHNNGSRHSMEEDVLDTDEDHCDQSSSISLMQEEEDQDNDTAVIYDDDAKTVEEVECGPTDDDLEQEMDAISISLSDEDIDNLLLNVGNEVIKTSTTTRNRNRMSQEDQEMKMIVMELKISDLNEKILKLMERIRELTDKNNYLELSKMELVINTANAMNDYRDTIKKLNQQNMRLLKQIKHG